MKRFLVGILLGLLVGAPGVWAVNVLQSDTLTVGTSVLPDAVGGADIGSTSAEWGDLYLDDGGRVLIGNAQDVILSRHSANILQLIGSTPGSSTLYVCNTSDCTTNFERVQIGWSSNEFFVEAQIGGSGTARDISIGSGSGSLGTLNFRTAGNIQWSINNAGELLPALGVNLGSTTNEVNRIFIGDISDGLQFGVSQDVLLGRGAANQLQLASGDDFDLVLGHIGHNNSAIDVNGATTFAADGDFVTLTCTGAESINTITGGLTGNTITILHADTDCTLVDDDDPTASNAINLTGTATNDVGAADKVITLFFDGTHWIERQDDSGGLSDWSVVSTNFVPDASNQTLGSASAEIGDLFLDDGGAVQWGLAQDVTLTRQSADMLVMGTTDGIELTRRLDITEIAGGDTPGTGDLTADAEIAMFTENDCLVFAYNNGGVMTFIKFPLDGSTTSTTHNTTDPTTSCS